MLVAMEIICILRHFLTCYATYLNYIISFIMLFSFDIFIKDDITVCLSNHTKQVGFNLNSTPIPGVGMFFQDEFINIKGNSL